MKPDVQKILTKLAKEKENNIEVNLEKVELGVIDDLKKYDKELERGIDELMQFATDAREAIAKGVREMNRLDAVHKVAQKILSEAEKSAKDLGVKIPQIEQLKRMVNAYEQQKKSLVKVLK